VTGASTAVFAFRFPVIDRSY